LQDQPDRQEQGMFKRIAVAFDESPGAWHALASAISLAKVFNAQLHTVTVVEPSAYEPYVGVVPLFSQILRKDRLEFYEGLQQRAAIEGERHDIAIQTHLVTGDEAVRAPPPPRRTQRRGSSAARADARDVHGAREGRLGERAKDVCAQEPVNQFHCTKSRTSTCQLKYG
jgi:nucleotide-binding universal stress UspA family protein